MDVGEQGNPEVHHVVAQHLGLVGAPQGHRQRGGGGHGAHGGDIGGAVVPHHLQGIGAGVEAGRPVQHRHPDIVAHHHNEDHNEEDGQLLGDGPLIGQAAEGAGNEEGKDGDDHPHHHIQHYPLELLQHLGDDLRLGPGGRQAHQHREYQGGHHRHDGGDLQVEEQLGQLVESLRRRLDGQGGDDGVTRCHGHQSCAYRGSVGQYQGQNQHPGGILFQSGDGGSDKTDDDQGYAEVNERTQQLFEGQYHLHDLAAISKAGRPEAKYDASCNADQKSEGQALQDTVHR